MTTLAPLSSCPRWHPNQPSQIRLSHAVGGRGMHFQRRHCTLCRALMAKQRHNRDTTRLAVPDYGLALGVMRLSWTPPEFALA